MIIKNSKVALGFTLIELLVSIVILGTVGTMATIILFTTLQSASKSEVLREVKQNGDYALTVMERMIRNATEITSSCEEGWRQALTIKNPDGETTTFEPRVVGNIQKIASNSGYYLTSDKVTVSNLLFSCTRVLGKPDVAIITFRLSQAGATTRPEERASIDFRTTVSLRTY